MKGAARATGRPPLSMDERAADGYAATLRRVDPDRYFSALFAPASCRPILFALYAFNHELARIGEIAREPMAGEIRLQWWSEAIERARDGRAPSDLARALAARADATPGLAPLLQAMIAARRRDLSSTPFAGADERDAYLDATSGNLIRAAALILGAAAADEAARAAGIAYGIAGLVRNRRARPAAPSLLSQSDDEAMRDARAHLARARSHRVSRAALPAFLPVALVPLHLHAPGRSAPPWRRQIVLLRAAMQGAF